MGDQTMVNSNAKVARFRLFYCFLLRLEFECKAAVPEKQAVCVEGVKSFPMVCSISETDHFDIHSYSTELEIRFLSPYVRQILVYTVYTDPVKTCQNVFCQPQCTVLSDFAQLEAACLSTACPSQLS
jgi:hypothetical protein